MGGDVLSGVQQAAGYGVGALAALTALKSGGLQNFFINRQRLLEDPAFRATLVGSPFTSGLFFQSGSMQPVAAAPGTMPRAAVPVQPADFVGPPAPAATAVAAPNDVAWLQQNTTPERRWLAKLPPLSAENQVQVQAAQGIISGLQSSDPIVRSQAKLAGKIPLTEEETQKLTGGAMQLQAGLGPGSTVGLQIPGMPIQIGSPYNLAPVATDEYPTYAQAAGAANQRGGVAAGWTVTQTNRGTFKPVQAELPRTPPAPVPAGGGAPGQPAAAPAPAPAASTAPAPVPAPSATMPPPPPSPPPPPAKAPPAPPRPSAPPRPAAHTGTPALTAGQIVIPAEPPARPYAGAPYDFNAPAPGSVPARQGFPSPAFDDTATAAPAGAPAATPATLPQTNLPVYPAQGFVFHHSGGSTLEGLRATLQDRGLGSEYLMDRDGTVYSYAGAGSPHIQPNDRYGGIASGLTNKNAVGMELVAKNDADVTPAQVASARQFIAANYPNTPVYGHGEVNPGHKQASEGMAAVNAIRADRRGAAPLAGVQVASAEPQTVAYPSPAPAESVAPPSGGVFSWLGPSAAMAAEGPPGAVAVTREPIPEYRPSTTGTGIVAPAVPPTPPAPGAAPVAVEPQTAQTAGVPLSSITTGPGGTTYSYDVGKASSELASDMADAGITDFQKSTPQQRAKFNQLRTAREQRSLVSAEDTRRILRPVSPGEAAGTGILLGYRSALDKLDEDFPNFAERDQYIGLVNRPMLDVTSAIRANPRFALFVKDLSPFQGFADVKKSLTDSEVGDLSGTIPTGRESKSQYFEQNLFDFRQRLNESLGLRFALQQMPVGQQTAQWANDLRAQWARERAEAKTSDVMAAMGLGPPPAAAPPPSGGETPPTITLAPTTTSTSQPPTTTSLPPLVIFGHSPLY